MMAASLGLSLLVLFIWVRSFYLSEAYRGQTRNVFGAYTSWSVRSGEGIAGLVVDRFDFSDNPEAAINFPQRADAPSRYGSLGYSRRRSGPPVAQRYPPQETLIGSLGFQFFHRNDDLQGSDHTFYVLAIPFWALFFMTIAYPLSRYVGGVVKRQREERIALGLCPTCGTPMNENQSRCPGCDKPMALARQA